jgi:hypothetical protein
MLRIAGVIAVVMLSVGTAAAGPNLPAPPVAWDVNIVNTPVPVQLAGPSREPIELAGYEGATTSYGGTCIVDLYQVPAGKRLVVEWVSAETVINSASVGIPHAYVATGAIVHNELTSRDIAATYHLIPARQAAFMGSLTRDRVTIAQSLRLYVAAGNTLKFVWRYGDLPLPTDLCTVHVSGYLESI